MRAFVTTLALSLTFFVALVVQAGTSGATGSLSNGSLTMVSTRADGTSGPDVSNTFGADEEAISDDGKVIAFVSPVPAEQLVTDPLQTGHVTDTNNAPDVFVWDSRVPAPAGPIVTLVSWNNTHTGTGDGASQHPIMAPAGLGIVFESGADDLVTVPVGSFSNHLYAWLPLVSDLFPLFMVDENAAGSSGSDSVSRDASIAVTLIPPSARVAFTSSGTDLVDPAAHNSHGVDQVYVRTFTLPTPSTQMASVGLDGDGTASGARDAMIAADGIHVVFASGGADLVNGVAETGSDIFVRNLLTDSTTLISNAQGSGQGTSGNNSPVISADGSSVAWDSNDTNLSPTPHNAFAHVFYRSGVGPVQMVDTDFTGLIGCNSASNNPGLSLDGTMVVLESNCSDIVPPAITDDSGTDVFARRMSVVPGLPDPAPRLISINDAGTASGNGASFLCPGVNPPNCGASTNPGVTVNADGTAITFFSQAGDIGTAPGGVPPFSAGNVFVRYPDAPGGGKTVNLTLNGTLNADNVSRDPVISADGGSVAFVSLADDLVTPDTNGATDVFESDLHNPFFFQPIAAVSEGDGSVLITVGRSGNLGTRDTVKVDTGDGSTPDLPLLPPEITNPANSNAVAPDDYTATTKTLTFDPGVVTQTFSVPIVDDNVIEDPELFHVSLSSASGAGSVALPGPLSEAYVVILDNDADTTSPDVTVEQAAGQTDPTSTSPIEFTATFTEPVSGLTAADVDLTGSTAGGTLIATVTGGPSVYTIDVSGMTTNGTITAALPAAAAQDAAANPSTASTSTDNTVTWTPLVTSGVQVTGPVTAPVFGQAPQVTATVTVGSGTPAGSVQFAVDNADVGAPVALGVGGTATSPALTGLTPGSHPVKATFAPTDPATYAGSFGTGSLVVDKAATTTALTVAAGSLGAAVTAVAPGGGTPTGSVAFTVDGQPVGSAAVSGGTATLPFAVPAGASRHVAAAYGGDGDFLASSDSKTRNDPSLHATITSAHPKSAHGWYRSPVTVTFTCTTNGAPLVTPCPSPVTLTHDGAAQVVSRTITATNGGIRTVNVQVNLDRTRPTVHVTGVVDGGRYVTLPAAHCVGTDATSGIAACTITEQRHHHAHHSDSVTYRATATDKAGNTSSVGGSFTLVPTTILGAPYSQGAFTVHRGRTYTIVVSAASRPTYFDAAPVPQLPFHADQAFTAAGHHRWVLDVTMQYRLRAHRYWNLGVQIGGVMHVIRIRAVA